MTTQQEKEKHLNDILDAIAKELDISDAKFEEAENRYKAIGNWLNRNASNIRIYEPEVFPQGSFKLGTVIKPLSTNEYDVDLVCRLNILKSELSQGDLKNLIGKEIIKFAQTNNMTNKPENKRRCWTLDYSNEFHIDILPAIPDYEGYEALLKSRFLTSEWSKSALAITDDNWQNYNIIDKNWPHSNPIGYANWFRKKMENVINEQKSILAKSLQKTMDDIPDYKVKTPLQKTIQLVKRHRDIYFNNNDDNNNKPASVIITTVSAVSYNNEVNLYETFNKLTDSLVTIDLYKKNNEYKIINPSDPLENFADKWNENKELILAFKNWTNKLSEDFDKIQHMNEYSEIKEYLKEIFGTKVVEAASKIISTVSFGATTKINIEKEYPEVKFINPNKLWDDENVI